MDCILLCEKIENSLRETPLMPCHSDGVYQVKFHGRSSQMLLIEIRNMLLICLITQ